MAKVSRSMLKGIVKECLVEILAEGLVDSGRAEDLNESFAPVAQNMHQTSAIKPTNRKKNVQKNNSFEENTKKAISQATNDPIMASILEDTAKTTLQEQRDADSPNKFTAKPTDTYSQIANESDPMDLFGGASSNWAHLAFSDGNK